MPPESSDAPARSRRRGEALENAILEATWDELSEVGYSRFAIESVAVRAGTSKTVIYRRWPNRAALVFAARAHRMPEVPDPSDTGSLRDDLLTWITVMLRRHNDTSRDVIAGLITDAYRDAEAFAELRANLRKSALAPQIQSIVDRAAERGEIPTAAIPERVLRLPVDLLRSETILYGYDLPDEAIASIMDDIVIPLLKRGR